ncbi:MAG: FecR domain-containing protein [Bryobacteraceae bacterium]
MRTRIALLAAALLTASPFLLEAQPRNRDRRAEERRAGSGTGVARITAVFGDVSKRHGEGNEMGRADAGMPLVSGDWVRTAPASRAELRLDDSNFLRLGPDSEVRLMQLGERAFQVDVIRGTVSYTMLKHGEADIDLRSPNGNIVPQKDGVYRIEVPEPTRSRLTVRKGEAEVLTTQGSTMVKKGKTVTLDDSSGQTVRPAVASAPSKDGFDEWNQRRDKIVERARGPVYARSRWAPSGIHLGLGWGWGGWGGWGGPYWGPSWWGSPGYYRPVRVIGRSRIGRWH